MMKSILIWIMCLLMSVSTQAANDSLIIIEKKIKFGFEEAHHRTINSIIVHSTFNNSGGDFYDINLVLKQFSKYKVSAHYVIGRDGIVYRLVDEKNISYHAGKSSLPNGVTAVNKCSIGIEIMTSYTEAPTEKQINVLKTLISRIKKDYNIQFILRHSDIAPGRKTDPWNMNWKLFMEQLDKKQ